MPGLNLEKSRDDETIQEHGLRTDVSRGFVDEKMFASTIVTWY